MSEHCNPSATFRDNFPTHNISLPPRTSLSTSKRPAHAKHVETKSLPEPLQTTLHPKCLLATLSNHTRPPPPHPPLTHNHPPAMPAHPPTHPSPPANPTRRRRPRARPKLRLDPRPARKNGTSRKTTRPRSDNPRHNPGHSLYPRVLASAASRLENRTCRALRRPLDFPALGTTSPHRPCRDCGFRLQKSVCKRCAQA